MTQHLVICLAGLMVCNGLVAQTPTTTGKEQPDFRIDTDVLEPGKAAPIRQSVTLFCSGQAWDYSLDAPHRITLVDMNNGLVIFLDTQRQIQTRVNLQELQAHLDNAKRKLAESSLADCVGDAQVVQMDESAGQVQVGKAYFRYDAKFKPAPSANIATQYADFATTSACINAWQSPAGSPPPFARIQLNQTLRDRASLPTEISRTIVGRNQTIISRIHTSFSLSAGDQKKVEQFQDMLKSVPSIELAEYLHPNTPVNR
jgi:hypothetical protein